MDMVFGKDVSALEWHRSKTILKVFLKPWFVKRLFYRIDNHFIPTFIFKGL